MTLIRISTVKAENGIVTVNENSSVVITNVSGEIVEITVDMFDLSLNLIGTFDSITEASKYINKTFYRYLIV